MPWNAWTRLRTLLYVTLDTVHLPPLPTCSAPPRQPHWPPPAAASVSWSLQMLFLPPKLFPEVCMAHSLKVTARMSPAQENLLLPPPFQACSHLTLPYSLFANIWCFLHVYTFTNSPRIKTPAPWRRRFSSALFLFTARSLASRAVPGTSLTPFLNELRGNKGVKGSTRVDAGTESSLVPKLILPLCFTNYRGIVHSYR